MEGDGPEISVVIPTRNRETRLAFALDALSEQSLGRDRFEVVVVRSTDAVDGPLTTAPDGLRVSFRTSRSAGTAVQRNVGWRSARAPLVAFTDDDCRPAPEWLEQLVAAARGPDAILVGRTEPDPDERPLRQGLARTIDNPTPSGWYETSNIAYRRELLESLGGFDESIDFIGEDADLAMRARRAGADTTFVPDAVVWHAVHWRNVVTALGDVVRRRSLPGIVARHPELRRALWHGLFTDPDHARLLLAAAGIVFCRRVPPLAALACLPYVRSQLAPGPWSAWRVLRFTTRLLSRAVVDSVETLVLATSSVRHRTLVL
jgi:glycosyltransferase involved in cell wall biosynthesis